MSIESGAADGEEVVRKTEPESLEIERSRTGKPVPRRGGRYRHSRYDPEKEAERLVKRAEGRDPRLVVLLDVGWGYAVLAARRLFPKAKVIGFESDLELAELARRRGAWKEDDRTVFLARGEDRDEFELLSRFIDEVGAARPVFLSAGSADSDAGDKWKHRMIELVEKIVAMQRESLSTSARFGSLWWENSVRNLEAWTRVPDVSTWFNKAQGEMVIIFAAGPSLDDSLELFQGGDGGVRLVVDTAAKRVLESGIRVDAVLAADAQDWTLEHFSKLEVSRLLATPIVPPALWDRGRERILMTLAGPHFEWMASAAGMRRVPLKAGGSVTTFAFDLARRMSPRAILLVGNDFAFRAGRRYASGTTYEGRFGMHSLVPNRFLTFENYLLRNAVREEDGQVTDEVLRQYARWMEWEIAATKIPVYRAVDFGLLKNSPVIPPDVLRQFLERPAWNPPRPLGGTSETVPISEKRLRRALGSERLRLARILTSPRKRLAELGPFFEPIVRPFAVASHLDGLDDEAIRELTRRLVRAGDLLDEVLSEDARR